MHPLSFAELRKLPVIEFYEDSFRKSTGVPLIVVEPGIPSQRLGIGLGENEFCRVIAESPAGCEACHADQVRVVAGAALRQAPHQIACFAGLTDVAVPVIVGGHHLANMLSGQVLRREPIERDFQMIVGMVGRKNDERWQQKARTAYFGTPVVTAERLQAIIQMLGLFANYLGEYATRQAVARAPSEPPAIAKAKDYVEAHIGEPISLDQMVRFVGVSRFYFCKLFKKSTGLTLTEHVTRMRLEKAKAMLLDPSVRISEVAFAAGFGSIPQFNSVFKRYLGVAPTKYREAMRRESSQSSSLAG
jgi:AraC-like DNA-binding protein/ligand-binding sensor protein